MHPRPAGRKLARTASTVIASTALAAGLSACGNSVNRSTSRETQPTPSVAGTSVPEEPVTTLPPTTVPMPAPPTTVPLPPTPSTEVPAPRGNFATLQARAAAAGVPDATSARVVASACYGDEGRPHWGYYNNGALGGAITERDGAVVPLDGICLNPNQPDPYSSLLHELGHRYLWNAGYWNSIGAAMGGIEHATECFARHYGASTFGQGGCSAADADRLAGLLGL